MIRSKIEHYFIISLLLFVSVGYSLQFIVFSSSIMLHLWSTKASMVELSHSSQYICVPRSLAEAYTWLHDFPFCKYQKISTKMIDYSKFIQLCLVKVNQIILITLLRHHSSQECQTVPSIYSPVTLSTKPHTSLPLKFPCFAKVVHILGPIEYKFISRYVVSREYIKSTTCSISKNKKVLPVKLDWRTFFAGM